MNECRRMDVVIIGRKDSHQVGHFDEVPIDHQVHSDFLIEAIAAIEFQILKGDGKKM